MKIHNIEKNVPIPAGKQPLDPILYQNAGRMDVGDSFVVTLDEKDTVTCRAISTSVNKHYKKLGKKFKAKVISEHKIRLWRIE